MTYFHTDDPATIDFLTRAAALAEENHQSLRIDVDDAGRLRIKRGGGMWSAPIRSTPDMFRDSSQQAKVDDGVYRELTETVRLCTGCQGEDHDHSVCGA